MNTLSQKKALFLLLLIFTLTTIPFLGLTDFNTKGEPREAIVAYSMLETGNWILPTNNGGEMAYKPPFFHWCIAAFSEITRGEVTEFTSRFPSALSAIVMLIAGFFFFVRKRATETAFVASLIAFTAFEVHRAAFACRVDMVLTFCIVCALFSLFYWCERGCKKVPWLAILLMSMGTLTKGPVAIILPCGVAGAYLLMRGWNFWKACWRLILVALAALIIPLIWYYAAYQQGGDEFISLVKEENIDRFAGKMSYGSHENPWTYNLMTVVTGLLPWTLALLLSLFSLKYSKPTARPMVWIKDKWNAIRNMDAVRLFSLIAIVVIFVFYCIPKSKRSVYLLPIYPFIAYFIAEYIIWLMRKGARSIKVYGNILAGISILLVGTFIAIKLGIIPDSLFKGKHAAENIAYLKALEQLPLLTSAIAIFIPLAGTAIWFRRRNILATIAMTVSLYISMDMAFQPTILNVKSDRDIAEDVRKICPEGNIESYIKTDMMHFFTINFYNSNRVGVFEPGKSTKGYILLGENEASDFINEQKEAYDFEPVYRSKKRSCDLKQIVLMYRYSKKSN